MSINNTKETMMKLKAKLNSYRGNDENISQDEKIFSEEKSSLIDESMNFTESEEYKFLRASISHTLPDGESKDGTTSSPLRKEVKDTKWRPKSKRPKIKFKFNSHIGYKENKGQEEQTDLDEQRSMICGNMNFAASEAYKLLRANLLFTLPDNKNRVVGVTSSTRGEGKSMTAINLSYTMAQAGKTVLLIDADMRIPSVSKRLDLRKRPGLSNALAEQNPAHSCIQRSGALAGFDVMVAGDIPPNPSELLSSSMMDKILDELSNRYDFIIIDLPPVNLVSDAIVLSSRIDGLIMVVRENYTSQFELKEAVGKLEFLDSKILGFCVTDTNDMSGGYKRYRGRYRKYYKYGGYRGYRGYRNSGYSRYGDRYSKYGDMYQDQETYTQEVKDE